MRNVFLGYCVLYSECVVCVVCNGFQVRFRAVYRVVLRYICNQRYLDSILC